VTAKRSWRLGAGCILIAANLRPALTSVGPLIGDIRATTGMSATVAGLLTALPLLAFGVLSPLVPWVARRLGVERVLLGSLALLTVGIAIRSADETGVLLLGTMVVGTAISAGNVLLPGSIKQDFPDQAGLMIGLYSTTLAATAGIAGGRQRPPRRRHGPWVERRLVGLGGAFGDIVRRLVAIRRACGAPRILL